MDTKCLRLLFLSYWAVTTHHQKGKTDLSHDDSKPSSHSVGQQANTLKDQKVTSLWKLGSHKPDIAVVTFLTPPVWNPKIQFATSSSEAFLKLVAAGVAQGTTTANYSVWYPWYWPDDGSQHKFPVPCCITSVFFPQLGCYWHSCSQSGQMLPAIRHRLCFF